MAQGAVQALEDAIILAVMLDAEAPEPALQAYFAARKPRVSQVQARSLSNLRMFHKSGFAKFASYAPIWGAGLLVPNFIQSRQDWIYGFDPTRPTEASR